jgi:diaminopimelate decarboxylase
MGALETGAADIQSVTTGNNTIPASWWQRADLCYREGFLHFAGHRVERLAAQFGTPSFVYSIARVEENIKRIKSALDTNGLQGRYRLLYAMKANRFAPLLTLLKQKGLCGIDACSPQEVELAVSCGFAPADISFTAGSLSEKDVEMLARFDGLFMDCDSLHAIKTWGELKPGSEIGIRINPAMGVSRAANDKLQYAGSLTTKFGIYRSEFSQALVLAAEYGLKVTKIHFHTGCGYLTEQLPQWEAVIENCMWFVEQAKDVRCVNVGGGLGVPHVASDQPLDLNAWAQVLKRQFGHRNVQLEIEPGDYIVKDAGLLLLGLTFQEQKNGVDFAGVDAGFNIAPEPAYYQLPFQPLALRLQSEATKSVNVVGNINEALDVWFENACLPDLSGHKYLTLINAGGYSSSMASNHCMRGQFKEFLIY